MAKFLIRGCVKKWCHLTDSMELRVTVQLDVLISNDYVWTQTTNGLALLVEREDNFSPYIRATSECKYLNSTP